MMLRRRDRDSELERRLTAERPEAPEELIRRLAARLGPGRPARHTALPRIALITAITAAFAVSLGAAGVIGSAAGSIHAFSTGALRLVRAPSTHQENQGSLDPRFWVGRRFGQLPPFVLESSGKVPICYRAEIISVDLLDYFWYFTHGGLPARDCYVHR